METGLQNQVEKTLSMAAALFARIEAESRDGPGVTRAPYGKAEQAAHDAVAEAARGLGLEIRVRFCPHNVPPTCYCRKPQAGMGVGLIREHDLDPSQCVYVGDQTTDKTFAKRLGFQYEDAKSFFK